MPPIRTYKSSQIEQLAEQFLANYWLSSKIWVDIEYIIENDLGVDIDYAFLDSERVIGLIGIRADGTKVIVVEEKLANEYPLQYRSTLAQEVGHLVLHKELLEMAKTSDEALALHKSLTETQYALMETDANIFALALLMPSKSFADACMDVYPQWFSQIKKVGEIVPEFLLGKIVEETARRFQVSTKAASLRLDRLGHSNAILDAAYKRKPTLQL